MFAEASNISQYSAFMSSVIQASRSGYPGIRQLHSDLGPSHKTPLSRAEGSATQRGDIAGPMAFHYPYLQ